jgi:hypothetical protein
MFESNEHFLRKGAKEQQKLIKFRIGFQRPLKEGEESLK